MTPPELFQIEGARAKLYPPGPVWEGTPAATIGNWSCTDPAAGTKLLRDIKAQARARGHAALLGPMDGDTWHSYRLVVDSDGSKPFLMEPSGSGAELWQAAGFAPVSHYFSARAPLPSQTQPPAQTSAEQAPSSRVQVTAWDGTDPEAQFAKVYDLSVQAFAQNLFYTPISLDDFLAMYLPFVPMLRPEFVLFAHVDGALQGFLFGVPNYAEGPGTQTAILKTYAGLQPGVGRALVDAFFAAARSAGFTQAIHALIQDDNRSAERSRRAGGTVFRRYALMGQRL